MPFTKYVCPTFTEDLGAATFPKRLLDIAAIEDLKTPERAPLQDCIKSILSHAHELRIPLAFVDGVLAETPAATYTTWGQSKDIFELEEHRTISILPIGSEVKPATLLAQINYHRRRYTGESDDQLQNGTVQRFLTVQYSEFFGIASIRKTEDGKVQVDHELGAIGQVPVSPREIPTNLLIDEITSFSRVIECLPMPKPSENPWVRIARYGFVAIEKHPPDSDDLKKFVKLKELEFLKVTKDGVAPWPRPPRK